MMDSHEGNEFPSSNEGFLKKDSQRHSETFFSIHSAVNSSEAQARRVS